MVRQEKHNPIGDKFRFTHLNRSCLVLPWLDVRRNRLNFPLDENLSLQGCHRKYVEEKIKRSFMPNLSLYVVSQEMCFEQGENLKLLHGPDQSHFCVVSQELIFILTLFRRVGGQFDPPPPTLFFYITLKILIRDGSNFVTLPNYLLPSLMA